MIADPLRIVGGGQVARFDKNKAAIEMRNRLVEAGRAPTREEQEVLAGYTGWGSFGQELFQGTWERPAPKKGWEERDRWLRDNMGRKEWEGLQTSIINAHYTDPPTVMAMWDMVRRMGFTGGRTLEPSIGIGNFYGLMPAELTARSQRAGIELDPMTGSMAQMLYPRANIQIKGYEESTTPDNFYDLVIGNWPFFEQGPADRRYNRLSPTLHDYFFLKAIDQTKPGGLVVGITTHGTMDKKGVGARMEMARKAELVAAFRLPSGAFEEYAGTKVVTDIIILRKRERPTDMVANAGWIDAKDHDTAEGTKVTVNEYFHRNPSHVIGRIDFGHGTTTFRPGLIVHRPDDMMGQLRRIVDLVPEGAFRAGKDTKRISYVANHTSDRTNALVKTDKGLFIVQGEYLAPANEVAKYELKDEKKTAARVRELEALIDMRRLYAQLIDAERAGAADTQRAALRTAYEAFVKQSGPLAESFGLNYLRKIDDPFYPSLAALEVGADGANGKRTYRPATILSQSTMRGAVSMANPSITDAFVLARSQAVNPPIQLIAEIAKKPEAEVKAELLKEGAVFELPNGDFAPADVYLSGNVREKLREAQAALKSGNAAMQRNVDALTEVLPPTIPYYKIETQMGATWVPPRAYEEYIAHMLGMLNTEGIKARFEGGAWKLDLDTSLNHRPQASSGAGVPHVKFKRLVRAAIANQTITVKYKDNDGTEHVDEEATKATNAAIADMRLKFGEWLWSEPTRRVELEAEYNEVRNAYATPRFDGSFLPFQGMALTLGRGPFNLRQHQVNAIWRALVTRKSLNAHEVGTGKTFTMGGIAVESRRYGIAKKPLILAHNANSKSVASEIQQMYPAAKILYLDNLSKENVKTRMMQIANDDWDAVVVPHSLIDRLGFKKETLMGMAKEEIADLEVAAQEAAAEDGVSIDNDMWDDEEALKKLRSPTAKQLVKQRLKIISTINKLSQQASREDSVAFEDLGVDMVMVDEAHEFKKPPIATKMKMKGLQTATSDRSIALMFMTKYVRAMNGGGNVHLFTGTPITNTMTEVFHMMRYMMQEEMKTAALADWDGWFGSFAREVNDVELNPAGEYEAVTRLQSFINVPELRRMIGQYMDVVFAEDMPEMQLRKVNGKRLTDKDLDDDTRREILEGRTVPTKDNPAGATDRPYKKVVNLNSDMDPAQLAVFEKVQGWARSWRSMTKKQRKEAMSSGAPESPIIHEGIAARASFDVRLVDAIANAGKEGSPELAPHPDSKPARALANLLEIYRGHPEANQVVFMDQGIARTVTRREGPAGEKRNVTYPAFSTAYDMIERLVQAGVPREQIALVDGSTSKDKRKEIADAMNSGKIRIVFGSSDSLGVGVNMQRNLRAMHHMDAPWMPGELEQRNGRGHRQGNQWNTVLEFRYLTDRLDGRRWQVLAIKQKFITDFMKAKGDVRVIEGDAADDSGGDILSTFSEAAGDPRLLLREKFKKKLDQLQSRERIHGNAVADALRAVDDQTRYIADDERELERLRKAGTRGAIDALIQATMGDGFSAKIGGKEFDNRKDAQEALKLWVTENVRKNDRIPKLVGSLGGQPLYVEWRYAWSDEPSLVMKFPGDAEVTANLSWQSLEAQLRQRRDTVEEDIVERLAGRREKVAHAKKVSAEPFHMADKLAEAKQKLADLEEDIERNPVAPPYWLRAGAPIDTEVIYNGKPFTVTGHRWSDAGYFVVGTDARGELPIPYMEAMDTQGMPLYEAREFKKPEVVKAKDSGMKRGDAYDIRAKAGVWRVLNEKGEPYAGQPSGGFKSQAEAQLWADTRPDPTAPADYEAERIASVLADWERVNGPAPMFSRRFGNPSAISAQDAEAAVALIRQALPNAPQIVVLERVDQAPRALLAKIRAARATDDVEAAYHDGKVFVFPANITSLERLEFVVAHHEIRHHGIRVMLGDAYKPVLMAMWRSNQRLRAAAKAKRDARLANDTVTAVDEALADMPLEELAKLTGFKRLVAAARQWLRQVAAKLRASGRRRLAAAIEPKHWTDNDVAAFVLRAERVSKDGAPLFRAGSPTMFSRAPATDSAAFRRWFGDSKVVDAEGRPLVVYHGTSATTLEAFDDSMAGSSMGSASGLDGFYFTADPETAGMYAKASEKSQHQLFGRFYNRQNILPVLLSMQNPLIYKKQRGDASTLMDTLKRRVIGEAKQAGNDGVIFQGFRDTPTGRGARVADVFVAFRPEQIKSAIGNRGTFDPKNPDIRFSRSSPINVWQSIRPQAMRDHLADILGSAGAKVSWLDRTLATQYAKAEKFKGGFRKVFNAVQDYIDGTSTLANEAADQAKSILPQLKTWRDLGGRPLNGAEIKALAGPIFSGTLNEKRRFTAEELKDRWGLNDKLAKAYNEFLDSVAVSLDQVTASDVLKALAENAPADFKRMAMGDRELLREAVTTMLAQATARAESTLEQAQEELKTARAEAKKELKALHREISQRMQKPGADVDALRAEERERADKIDLDAKDQARAVADATRALEAAQALEQRIAAKYDKLDQLQREAYAPLMRFGKFKVHVVSDTGETLYFSLFESRAAANRMARMLADDPEFEGASIERGVISEEQHKLFAKVPLESMEVFAEAAGIDNTELFQTWLKLTKNNRSAMKRLIQRKGTAGFVDDVPRVLAAFVTSNARMASAGLHLGDTDRVIKDEIREGDIKDEAIKLVESARTPTETAAALRGLLYVNFIGGSMASAIVNLTQPITMTAPYLSQWGGMGKASARLLAAGKDAASGKIADAELRDALKKAEADGIVSPQEIHHLQAEAMRTMGNHWMVKKGAFLWGSMFSLAEQFNRRVSFIAAYRTAQAEGIANPFAFAERAVIETQGLYNAGNKPNWARNPLGATALTFKQFSIHWIEWFIRMAKSGKAGRRAALWALVILAAAAGAEGLPFMEDVNDVVDTLAQAMGYEFSLARTKHDLIAKTLGLGDDAADVALRGFSAVPGLPFDVSLRLSMGNLLPATGLLLRSNTDKSRDLLEVAGAAGGLAGQYLGAAEKVLAGEPVAAAKEAMPLAFKNLGKAFEMWMTGEYRDTKGRKVEDASVLDGVMKFMGFQPQHIAQASRKMGQEVRRVNLTRNVEGSIADEWAKGLADGDTAAVTAARERLVKWNRDNPQSPIRITPQQLRRRVRELRATRAERFQRTAPKELRASVAEGLR